MKKKIIDLFTNIESEFFDIDHELKIATIKLHFNSPNDIFDNNYLSKKPVLSDDFMEWLSYAYDVIPSKYKLDLDVSFDDLNEWDSKELEEAFKSNIILEIKTRFMKEQKKDKVAYWLIASGVILFIAMILINNFWKDDSIVKNIFTYVFDIATTVTFWEAMNILIVEKLTKSNHYKNLITRFHSIKFHKKI